MEGWRVLTPTFRQEINKGFDETIAELQTREQNSLVKAQIEGLKIAKNYINSLPDGCQVPVRKWGIKNNMDITEIMGVIHAEGVESEILELLTKWMIEDRRKKMESLSEDEAIIKAINKIATHNKNVSQVMDGIISLSSKWGILNG